MRADDFKISWKTEILAWELVNPEAHKGGGAEQDPGGLMHGSQERRNGGGTSRRSRSA